MKRSLSANEEWPKEIVEEEYIDVIEIDNESSYYLISMEDIIAKEISI